MYEKHIQALSDLKHYADKLELNTHEREALDAAIALMRAVGPKDEVAERAWCAGVATELDFDFYEIMERFLRERAAARFQGELDGYKRALVDHGYF